MAAFDPDAATFLTVGYECFSSEIIDNEHGEFVLADEPMKALMQALADTIDYGILECQIIVIQGHDYAFVNINVNLCPL